MTGPSTFKPFDILELSKKLVVACYTVTGNLPPEEKTNLALYIRNAALKVHLNSTQAVFAKKKKRKNGFVNAAKNSLVIIEAAVEVLIEVGLVKEQDATDVLRLSSNCYQFLDRLKKGK